nr:KilA-N domain-containing protein [Duganella guangzhouensis]
MTIPPTVKIAGVNIRFDDVGRFSLNDLHKAAGGEVRHQPAQFLRLDSTGALAKEMLSESDMQNPISVVRGGAGQGTFVCKELVYAYAMWISPKFHLQVIRTFDAVTTSIVVPIEKPKKRTALPKPPVLEAAAMIPPVFRALRACGIDKNAAAIGANQIAAAQTGVNLLAMAGQTHLPTPTQQICYTPTELGKRFCQSAIAFNRRLTDAGLQESINGHWVPTEKGRRHAVVLDTGKAHGNGTPIQQVKWTDSVLAEIAL